MNGLRHLKLGEPAIDVRSPGEFLRGHIPGFRNLPILDDDHRHQVGWTYKNHGNARAVDLGHELVDPLRTELVESWKRAVGNKIGLVTCWRGGLRSQIACEWIRESGAKVVQQMGGYKALRRELLIEIEKPREWIVLSGLTGSGKTDVLRLLRTESVVDLEKIANHRGSAFGGFVHSAQPAQQTFENAIGLQLFGNSGPLVIEDESAKIGRCSLPASIRKAILSSPIVKLTAAMDERVARVLEEYVSRPLETLSPGVVRDSLIAATDKIHRALGGAQAGWVRSQIEGAFASGRIEDHRAWIETLLKEYYDPMYEYGLERNERKSLFEGGAEDVRRFLADLINRRGT